MTAVFKIDGVEMPDPAVLMGAITGLQSAAWYCEPGISTYVVDDPEGAYDFAGWHTFTVDETACTGRERVWSGWLVGRVINRGPYKDGAARVFVITITDINSLFGFQVFRANSAQRPAETDVERMQWMIASAPMATTPVHDDGRFSTAGPTNLAAAEFVRSFPVDMASNAAGQSGKNVYAYWDHDNDEIGFSYGTQDEQPACDLRVSNDMADVDDATTFYPYIDAELSADAYGTYTGVLLDYVGGAVYGENQTLIDALSPTEFSPSEFKRDQMISSNRIGKLTTANAFLATYLAAAAQERETIELSVRLPAAQVNYVEAGMLIDVKLTHLPGLEDFTTLPIIRRSALPTSNPQRRDMWDVRIELSLNTIPALSLGGNPGDLPADNDPGGHWWEGSMDITGDEYAYAGTARDDFQPDADYEFSITISEDSGHPGTYATSVAPEVGTHTGQNSPDLKINGTPEFANLTGHMVVVSHSPGGDTEVFTGIIHTDASVDPTDVFDMRGTTADGDHSHTHHTSVSFWFDPLDDPDVPTPVPPAVGTWVINETPSPPPDAATFTFTTRWKFDISSLQVWVDNTEQTQSIASYDQPNQTFTMLFAPVSSERIKVRYKVSP